MWKEDLGVVEANEGEGRDVTVVLSGRDLIVDTEAVRRYLTTSFTEGAMPNGEAVYTANWDKKAGTTKIGKKDIRAWTSGRSMRSGLEVLWFEHLDHAQVFDCEETRRPIVEAIESYSAKGWNCRHGASDTRKISRSWDSANSNVRV